MRALSFRPKDDGPLAQAGQSVANQTMFYVYFIKSLRNAKVYVGETSKPVNDRVKDHNSGSNKWTKQNGPFKLIYYEEYCCQQDATKRESFYKTGFGKGIKKAIIQYIESHNIGPLA